MGNTQQQQQSRHSSTVAGLPYLNETLNDPNGVPHAVLDVARINYAADPTATYGTKTAPTFAFRATEGQKVITSQGNNIETSFICRGGEVVFVNRLPSGQLDVYVPRDKEGNSIGGQILAKDYKKTYGNLDDRGALFQPSGAPSKILLEAVKQPTVILNAYGEGNHQFLGEGATLKVTEAGVTGINQAAFDATWSGTDKQGKITRSARPPSDDFYHPRNFEKVLGPSTSQKPAPSIPHAMPEPPVATASVAAGERASHAPQPSAHGVGGAAAIAMSALGLYQASQNTGPLTPLQELETSASVATGVVGLTDGMVTIARIAAGNPALVKASSAGLAMLQTAAPILSRAAVAGTVAVGTVGAVQGAVEGDVKKMVASAGSVTTAFAGAKLGAASGAAMAGPYGAIIGGVVGGVAGAMGFEAIVNVNMRPINLTPEQKAFFAFVDGLPPKSDPSMSPELAALVDRKGDIVDAQTKLDDAMKTIPPTNPGVARRALKAAENRFTKSFEGLQESGEGLEKVVLELTALTRPELLQQKGEPNGPNDKPADHPTSDREAAAPNATVGLVISGAEFGTAAAEAGDKTGGHAHRYESYMLNGREPVSRTPAVRTTQWPQSGGVGRNQPQQASLKGPSPG